MEPTCPKCQGAMRQYERSGITVDQCTECRGVFLDRGELERLVDAENAWATSQAPAAQPAQPQSEHRDRDRDYEHRDRDYEHRDRDRDYGHHQGYGQPRRKKSFLEQMFD